MVKGALFPVLVLTLTAPLAADAQTGGVTRGQETRIGVSLGGGAGPTQVGVLSVSGTFAPSAAWGLRATGDLWHAGVGAACAQSWPESYACRRKAGAECYESTSSRRSMAARGLEAHDERSCGRTCR